MEITFLGAAGTVTGSRYLVRSGAHAVLVDCGLFQGVKQLRLKNRERLPFDPEALEGVVLTHAHLDHSGFLPVLVREGYRGPVFCTGATAELCGILLPDSGHLQEEEADHANRHGWSRHAPALPLYTEREARRALASLREVEWETEVAVGGPFRARFHPAGHIPGAAMVSLTDGERTVLFSGDLGRPDDPLLAAPTRGLRADYLVVESTYGDRRHDEGDPAERLADVVNRTAARGGAVLIPSFAVGRAQTILYHLSVLRRQGRIPDLPVFLDSPMAASAQRIFHAHRADLRISGAECERVCSLARATESVEESKRIDRMNYPRIIVSASGMATGGRVLHHLKALAPDDRNTILFAGYQAAGTRGAQMVGGARSVKIHGRHVPVHAEVATVENLSAHADADELVAWMRHFPAPPLRSFITHGEPVASDALRRRVEEELGWSCHVPAIGETATLDEADGAAPPPRRVDAPAAGSGPA